MNVVDLDIDLIKVLRAYLEMYKYWRENVAKLKGLPSGEYRSTLVNVNEGLVYSMNMLSTAFGFQCSHTELDNYLIACGIIKET